MGLLSAQDWSAQWIGLERTVGQEVVRVEFPRLAARMLRKQVELDKPVKEAVAYICGQGLFECYINGQKVGNDVLTPALSEFGKRSFYMTYDVSDKVQKGDIIVANKNFGCSSSREHAPLAIKCAGVSCVIAETFARIFYRNAINIGLPLIECPEAAKAIENGDEVEVDFDSGVITNKTKGETYQGQSFPPFMQKIISAGGLVNYINGK